jgi:hypothetical protein
MSDGWSRTESGRWRSPVLHADNARNDSNFIFVDKVIDQTFSGSYAFGNGSGGLAGQGFKAGSGSQVRTTNHFLQYQINNGGIIKIDLGISHRETMTWDYLIDVNGWYAEAKNFATVKTGQYIFEASTQINYDARTMLVTWLIYSSDAPYLSERKVLIIHMDTGVLTYKTREEMGVTKELWTNPAAIGVQLVQG